MAGDRDLSPGPGLVFGYGNPNAHVARLEAGARVEWDIGLSLGVARHAAAAGALLERDPWRSHRGMTRAEQ